MATASTKRNRKKSRDDWGAASSSQKRRESEEFGQRRPGTPAPESEFDIPERAWIYASAVILLLAFALRVYALDMKPLHHDEGVNGFFLTNLLRQGRYAYDPENYHGPTLYYLTLPFVKFAGLHTFVIRLVTSLFGVGVVWLVLALRRYVGTVAVLVAALFIAVSPACVFYSRYFIHEMPFVFFTLGLVISALRFRETGATSDLLLASASAALMFTTKETAFISVGTLGLAWLTAELWERVRGGPRGQRARAAAEPEGGFAKLRQDGKAGIAILGAVALFMLIWVAFYSSFFTHWQGVFWDSFRAFAVWRKTGMSEFHSKPFYTYIKWLMQEDVAILVLGTLGALVALFERRLNRFAVFAAAWGFGLLAAYSLISYKTPWLVLSFLVPLAVVGGYAVQAFSRVRRSRLIVVLLSIAVGAYLLLNSGEMLRNIYAVVSGTDTHVTATFGDILPLLLGFIVLLATFVLSAMWAKHQWRGWPWQASAALAAVVVVVSLYQTLVVNFVEYDNDQYPYVYSQTRREFVDLVREIERVGERAGTKEPGFATASPEYWPSPWYFRNNSHAGYEGRLSSYYDPKSTLAIIGREDQLPQLERVAGDTYTRVGGLYPLRPGVNLVLFVRRDLTPK